MPITERQKAALRAFVAVERLGRPDIGRTRTSRESDSEIRKFAILLAVFVAVWLLRGYFNQSEKDQLSTLFRRHAEHEYFLGQEYADRARGEAKPISRSDVDAIEKLAEDAERNFIADLQKQTFKSRPGPEGEEKTEEQLEDLAERTSSDLGIRSLNRGTLSNARFVEFVTRRDSRVCPICEDLDGDVFEVDPNTGIIKDGPLIPDDTHPNCRCRYLLLDAGEEEE